MAIEIERKFLVRNDDWRAAAIGSCSYSQAFLAQTGESSVRVRRSDTHATITVKGPRYGTARYEFEYPIPVADADHMLGRMSVTPIIEKMRHRVEHAGMIWEIDVYRGEAFGLVLAEVELDSIGQPFALPRWVGAEVTHDPRYRSNGIVRGLWREVDAPPEKKPMRSRVSRTA